MNDDSGLLSIDFIAGFTIFMIAFIMVVTMVSGLLVGLSSRTIDYDALAYRTGVILAEDAGDPGGPGDLKDPNAPGWELKNFSSTAEKEQIIRLGLTISKDYPNILSPAKVDKFFYHNSGLADTENLSYKQKLMLFNFNNKDMSSKPTFYHFNIRFKSLDVLSDIPTDSVPYNVSPRFSTAYVGEDDTGVQNYGYSRRVVKIKQPSSMNVDLSQPLGVPDQKSISISYNKTNLKDVFPLGLVSIDPIYDPTAINVTLNNTVPVNLKSVTIDQFFPNAGWTSIDADDSPIPVRIFLNSNSTTGTRYQKGSLSNTVNTRSNILIVVDPGSLVPTSVTNGTQVYLNCVFSNGVTNRTYPIEYYYWPSYSSDKITYPFLIPAVMEVKIW